MHKRVVSVIGFGVVLESVLSIFWIISSSSSLIVSATVLAEEYKPRYQPELDQLSLEKYIANERVFNLHINCLLFNGPCDPVGRWMRPRMASYLLSSCILCTPNQEKEADKFMTWLYHNHPQLFRLGIAKYLVANGISLPQDSKFREQVQKMNVPKVVSIEDAVSAEQQQMQTSGQNQKQQFPNQRILNLNSRKNKFSSAMMFNQQNPYGLSKTSSPIEDDEAELDTFSPQPH